MTAIAGARYAHTNLIARDWQVLSRFYVNLFGCSVVPPERHFAGATLDAGTGLTDVTLAGVHLRLPGYGPDGPTLEIFTYSTQAPGPPPAVNRPGFGHIAFQVESVADARAAVMAAGGRAVGDVVVLTTSVGTQVEWCYVTDLEGNIIELQRWR